MMTGLTPKTFERLQLDAGVFLVNFDYSTAKDAASLAELVAAAIESDTGCLGATRGGGSFECTPDTRTVEADGMRYAYVGSTKNDTWTIKLKTTLLEVTPENFAKALMCADVNKNGSVTTVKVRTSIEEDDYIPSLCWVGDTARGLTLINLENALNLTGASFTFADKGEGTLPVEFQAHQADLENQEYAPFEILFFDEATA